MAVRIVHELEVVDVEEQENHGLTAREAVAKRLVATASIRQARERITKRGHSELVPLRFKPLEHLAIAAISQLNANARLELVETFGHLNEVVSARKQAAHGPLFGLINRAHKHDRREPQFVDEAELAAKLDARHALEVHVEKDQIGRRLVDAIDGLVRVRGHVDAVALEKQELLKQKALREVVVHDEDTSRNVARRRDALERLNGGQRGARHDRRSLPPQRLRVNRRKCRARFDTNLFTSENTRNGGGKESDT